jgi:hypothetical protein
MTSVEHQFCAASNAAGAATYFRTVLRSNRLIALIAWMLSPSRFSSAKLFTSFALNRPRRLLCSRVGVSTGGNRLITETRIIQ